ncbi:hypothetical protein Psi02_76410 [Planotetraspora silvatica]|uniref:Uncharacterized protein n=1 Tax=Planotetraspora silvatica TaxID=234614 RepID=A0A8J3XQT3_9ACTN|nr:hypothetical protein [Planotetraspora silvatica]GII51217.1 hypothetical protein Psi02_76410 [Planotetraspora silvatica]
MGDYQRALIGRMVEYLDLYASGQTPLSKLVEDLWGLFEVSDPGELEIRDSFQRLWSDLDGECELRTQPWAPAGVADDDRLASVISELRMWATQVAAGESPSRPRTPPPS